MKVEPQRRYNPDNPKKDKISEKAL